MEKARIAVKYCGGCNPYCDRKEVVQIVESRLGVKLGSYNEEDIPDILLVVCGCKSECMNIDKFKSKAKAVVLNDRAGIDEVINIILQSGYI